MNSLLACLIACALSPLIASERWVPVGGSPNTHQDYLDHESIKRSGNIVTLWTRRDFVTTQRTAWNEIEVDCAKRRDTILAYIEDNSGSILHNTVSPHRSSTAIPPNSVGARIFDLVCR